MNKYTWKTINVYITCFLSWQMMKIHEKHTMKTFNSCTKCMGIIHNRTPAFHHFPGHEYGWLHIWTWLWFASYVGHWCFWVIFWDVIHRCLYNQALADDRSTGAGLKCLYCRDIGEANMINWLVIFLPAWVLKK